jgi:hypothetical protein
VPIIYRESRKMTKNENRMDNRGRRNSVIVVLIAVIFIAGFAALVVIDRGQQAGSQPPEGVETFENLSRDHTQGAVSYPRTPPVGGDHNPMWQNQGFYEERVRNENAVHTLEHGAVWITYSPDLPEEQVDRIRELVEGQTCVLASPSPDLPAPVVASAWGNQLRLDSADDQNLEQFVSTFRQGTQTPEPGARCTGGTGDAG